MGWIATEPRARSKTLRSVRGCCWTRIAAARARVVIVIEPASQTAATILAIVARCPSPPSRRRAMIAKSNSVDAIERQPRARRARLQPLLADAFQRGFHEVVRGMRQVPGRRKLSVACSRCATRYGAVGTARLVDSGSWLAIYVFCVPSTTLADQVDATCRRSREQSLTPAVSFGQRPARWTLRGPGAALARTVSITLF